MKKILTVALLLAAIMAGCSKKSKTGFVVGNSSEFDTLSYAMGSNLAFTFKFGMGDLPLDYSKVCEAINDVARGKDKIEHQEAVATIQKYFGSRRMATDSAAFASDSQRDSVSYGIGIDVGNNLKKGGLPIQSYWFCQALKDNNAGEGKLTEEQTRNFLQHYFMVVMPARNLEESVAWLEETAKKDGVVKTESGLLYQIVEPGSESERAVNDADQVQVHYKGLTRKGTQFDSSYDRGEPATFPLNGVIRGWSEGMKLVGKGGKINLWIPADLAYGERGAGQMIGPNEALYFEVEVLDVIPAEAKAEEQPAEEAPEAQK